MVPYRCHSAGTLICLGADEIVMTKLAELTPVDPTSTNHPFNPLGFNPINLQQKMSLPVSVEDVRSYLYFAKDVLEATNAELLDLYSKMTNRSYPQDTNLHPLALGNVYRVQKMIRQISERLLAMHFKNSDNKAVVNKIVKEVTEDISVHNYPIYYDQAKELELNVKRPDENKSEEKLIWDLFESYSDSMKLSSPFSHIEEIGQNAFAIGSYHGAYIESLDAENAYEFTYQISKITQPQNILQPNLVNFSFTKNQWIKIR